MRELSVWGARALMTLLILGAVWPWMVPLYSHALAHIADALLIGLRAPFSVHALPQEIEMRWQPLRYTTFEQLQQQMGYVDRFARRGLQGYPLLRVNALYLQSGVLVAVALIWGSTGVSLRRRLWRSVLALGLLLGWQTLDLIFSTHIEFQLRQRYLSASETMVILQDPEWYLYYGIRSLPITMGYLMPWLIGGVLAVGRPGVRGAGYEVQHA